MIQDWDQSVRWWWWWCIWEVWELCNSLLLTGHHRSELSGALYMYVEETASSANIVKSEYWSLRGNRSPTDYWQLLPVTPPLPHHPPTAPQTHPHTPHSPPPCLKTPHLTPLQPSHRAKLSFLSICLKFINQPDPSVNTSSSKLKRFEMKSIWYSI